jgi:hypothetical protein
MCRYQFLAKPFENINELNVVSIEVRLICQKIFVEFFYQC